MQKMHWMGRHRTLTSVGNASRDSFLRSNGSFALHRFGKEGSRRRHNSAIALIAIERRLDSSEYTRDSGVSSAAANVKSAEKACCRAGVSDGALELLGSAVWRCSLGSSCFAMSSSGWVLSKSLFTYARSLSRAALFWLRYSRHAS